MKKILINLAVGLVFCAVPAALAGVILGVLFWDEVIGEVAAGLMFLLCADILVNGRHA